MLASPPFESSRTLLSPGPASPSLPHRRLHSPRTFTLTLFDAPAVRPGGSPEAPAGVVWPTRGRRWRGDLGSVEQLLTTRHRAAGKFVCPFFLVGAFTGDERRNNAFELASVVALDIEGGPTTQAAHERFIDLRHLIYTTWQHDRDAHRFRLVFPLARDLNADEYRLVWAHLAERLGSGVDTLTKDLARALFLPAVRPDGRRAAAAVWSEAPLLDPNAVLAEAASLATAPSLRTLRPLRPIKLPWDEARRAARRRLAHEPEARRRAAVRLQARVREQCAHDVVCPGCGRPSVWFWLNPGKLAGVRCKHLNSCGWSGPLDVLLDASGTPDV